MTKAEFDKAVSKIFQTYGVEGNKIETLFGNCKISCEKITFVYSYYLHMKFEGSVHQLRACFSDDISKTGKWNIYSRDPDFILTELEERLDNLKYFESNPSLINEMT